MLTASPRGTFLAISLSLWAGNSAFAEAVTLEAIADTCLFEFDPTYNFGRQRTLPGGSLGDMAGANAARARVLYKFGINGAIPPGATIESARMTLAISSQIPTRRAVSDFSLSRVKVDWGEGQGFGENPGGREAIDGEASWNQRFDAEATWSSPGGVFGMDYANEPSATVPNVDGSRLGPTSYVFVFNDQGLADLELMVNGVIPNFGWVLWSHGEGTLRTARRWVSRETITEGPAPELEITFTTQPSPAPPELTAIEIDPVAQELCVRLEGRVGFSYELQSGLDLTEWTPGEVQVPAEDGELTFRVPLGPTEKFVRVEAIKLPE